MALVASCGRGSGEGAPASLARATAPAATAATSPATPTGPQGSSRGVKTAAEWTAADFVGFCDTVSQGSRYWGPGPIEAQRLALEAARQAGADTVEEARLAALLGRALLRSGDLIRAEANLEAARRVARERGVPAAQAWGTWWLSALTRLRMAEIANCIDAPTSTGCLLAPHPPAPAYADLTDAEAARELLLEGLRFRPSPRFRRAAAWLVNLLAVLEGRDATSVPDDLRIDLARFEAPAGLPPLPEVARGLGVDALDLAGGSVIEDLNGDGRLDIASTTMDPCGGGHLFVNNGDGTFADMSVASGLAMQPGALNVVQADYDNDGFADLLLLRGGWLFAEGRHRNSLLHNNGDGTFTDVTVAAGLAEPAYPTQVAAWADYDGDGDVDVFIGNEEAGKDRPYPSQLYRNNGDGTFRDVATQAGVTNDAMAKGAAWGDVDNDGDPDLYVSNLGPNRLYVNQGDGTFTDKALAWGVVEPLEHSFVTWFWDMDNDGWEDLFVAGGTRNLDDFVADYQGQPNSALWPRVYRNTGGQGFADVTAAAGVGRVLMSMGANYGDLNNDGYPDALFGTGGPGTEAVVPNAAFQGLAGRGFEDVTFATGLGLLTKGHGVSFGDIDGDGDQDIYLQAGGMYPGDEARNALFENPGHGSHWATLRLTGTQANRSAIGARLTLTVEDASGPRRIAATVGSGGSFGANSLQAEIGLGQAESIRSLTVLWPGSGTRQTFRDLPVDRVIALREGSLPLITEPEAIRLARPP